MNVNVALMKGLYLDLEYMASANICQRSYVRGGRTTCLELICKCWEINWQGKRMIWLFFVGVGN